MEFSRTLMKIKMLIGVSILMRKSWQPMMPSVVSASKSTILKLPSTKRTVTKI